MTHRRSRRTVADPGAGGGPERARSESGYAALELALGIGLILMPVALLVLSLPGWVERSSLARTAAREAARLVVTAEDPANALEQATALVERIAENHGVRAEDVGACFSVHAAGTAPPSTCTGPAMITRMDAVTVHVSVRLPALTLPGSHAQVPSSTRTLLHTERVDRYRTW